MVRYNGRNKLLTSAVNGNQIGLKMGGAAPSVGSAISTRRHTKRRVRDNLKFCGPVYYRGQLWNFNTENCVVRAPITQASAGGVGHINHPRKKCNSNCSLEKCNIADSIKLVRQYFIKKYGEDGIALVAPAETLASDGINEHINGPILHFDPNHSPYYTLPKNIREAVDCINALELKYRLKDSPDKKRHIVGHLPQDTQQALRAAYFGNFMETFGSETIYAFGYGVTEKDLRIIVKNYLNLYNFWVGGDPNNPARRIPAANPHQDPIRSRWNEGHQQWHSLNDVPIGPVGSMSKLFMGELYFNEELNNWDTSRVTDMSYMFKGAAAFNGDGFPFNISNWKTGSVTDMSSMFEGATAFNGYLNSWDTSRVIDMSNMFNGAIAFNRDISNWKTGSVTYMSNMFNGAIAFNGDINNWDTSKVGKMDHMFQGATAFNGYLNSWDTSRVIDMSNMFNGAIAFNRDISNWKTGSVTYMSNMFNGAIAFNGDINNWDTSKVGKMDHMFQGATAFNKPLNKWDVEQVWDMRGMFLNARDFVQDLSNWSVGDHVYVSCFTKVPPITAVARLNGVTMDDIRYATHTEIGEWSLLYTEGWKLVWDGNPDERLLHDGYWINTITGKNAGPAWTAGHGPTAPGYLKNPGFDGKYLPKNIRAYLSSNVCTTSS